MAAANVVAISSLYPQFQATALSSTSATVVLNNAAASNKLLLINSIRATNVDGTNPCDITISLASQDDGGGTLSAIASTIAVPADGALIIADKNDSYALVEDRSLVATASAANDIVIVVSYNEIDDA